MSDNYYQEEEHPDIYETTSISNALTFQFEVVLTQIHSQLASSKIIVVILSISLTLSTILFQVQPYWIFKSELMKFLPATLVLIIFCLVNTLLRVLKLFEAAREGRKALLKLNQAKEEVLFFVNNKGTL